MDKDMKCCWNCQLRTDNECMLIYGDQRKNIIKNAEPCDSWVKRQWNEEILSTNIGPFGDKEEYISLKAKYQNSIFVFLQKYFSYIRSFYSLKESFERLEKKESYNEEFLSFMKAEIPDVYKKLKLEYKKQKKEKEKHD